VEELKKTYWFNENWLDDLLNRAPVAFDNAFDRWRELYKSVMNQLRKANELNLSPRIEDQEEARKLSEQAQRQRRLLLHQEVQREEGDFYPYRYLATEGFLPGYNFPALPVRAWVPRGESGEFISRPRFLAIREFAPFNIIYHERTKWEVVKFQIPPGGLQGRIQKIKVCNLCQYISEIGNDKCPCCGNTLDAFNSTIIFALEMPNVILRRAEKITCNEEERIKYGFRRDLAYQFTHSPQKARVGDLIELQYAPSANIFIFNHGWRKSREQGFIINLETGEILKEALQERPRNMKTQNLERLSLFVQDTQNLLRLKFLDPYLIQNKTFETTLKYAFKRGIEQYFQIEEDEIVVESVGGGDERGFIFYEASEGGCGVLRNLIEDPWCFSEVAKEALKVLHFDPETGEDLAEDDHHACYECILSYTNQLEAHYLNRHEVKDFLLLLTTAKVEELKRRSREEHYLWLKSLTDSRSELERKFLEYLYENGYRLPDDAQKLIEDPKCIPDFFYEPNVCVFCDGAVHDEPEQKAYDEKLRRELRIKGYRVIVIRYDEDLASQVKKYPDVFGRKRA